ncbi:MAG: hypothetical protein EOP48_34730, partial [Sphingobacteriales bacterium]
MTERYSGYESWLKTNKYVSWKTYLSFVRQIENDLGGIDIEKINSVAYLKKLMAELQTKNAYLSRGSSDRGNILSGFRTYID